MFNNLAFLRKLQPGGKWLAFVPALLGLAGCSDSEIDEELLNKVYGEPLASIDRPLKVFHLGHSLVGRDMPAMLKQLADGEHDYRSQLGWGATLKSHWDPDEPINGFKEENDHPMYQDVNEAIDSKVYDAMVVTEMVEIRDAIKYFDSDVYLSKFANAISEKSPSTRLYVYETWHEITDKDGWISRLDTDYSKYWLSEIVDKTLIDNEGQPAIYLVPVGQVFSAFFKEVAAKGGLGGLTSYEDIFAMGSDGKRDPIHINDIGAYFVAIVHYSVLYQKNPIGLPHKLRKADGSTATAPSEELALAFQKIAWEVVQNDPRTGLAGKK